jgi:hypothetical protein
MHKITLKDMPYVELGDIRRNQRLLTIIGNISSQPGNSIPKLSDSWYEAKATYEFFKNEEVTIQKLQEIIRQYGASQLQEEQEILVVHDISNISFNDLQAEGLGYLDSKEGRGIMCYSSLAISPQGLPLALLYQQSWVRPLADIEKELKKSKGKRPFEEKQSYRWHEGMAQTGKLLSDKAHKIHIADREADVYELFFSASEPGTDLLIRAYHNRQLSDGNQLWDSVGSMEEQSERLKIAVWDGKGKNKEIEVSVRYQAVEILRPSTNKTSYESVELTAIEIKQQTEGIKEEERICWRLLTSLEVSTVRDIEKCVRWYSYRWLIERFHYVLKSGTQIEQLQLKQASSLQKAIAVYSLAAFSIMQLVYQSRSTPEVSCEVILTKSQWQVLYMLKHKNNHIPDQPPTLKQAVMWIGRLGGHLGRNADGPPGLKTVWLGYEVLTNATIVYEIMNQKFG